MTEAHPFPLRSPVACIWNENHQWQGLLKTVSWTVLEVTLGQRGLARIRLKLWVPEPVGRSQDQAYGCTNCNLTPGSARGVQPKVFPWVLEASSKQNNKHESEREGTSGLERTGATDFVPQCWPKTKEKIYKGIWQTLPKLLKQELCWSVNKRESLVS